MNTEQMNIRDRVTDWQKLMFLYKSALREVKTKLDIMSDEFQYIHQYNPIEYVKSRIKTPESTVKKLKKHGYDTTLQNMVDYINDIAGFRIVCSFTSDIYILAKMIEEQPEFHLLYTKDYISYPKASGYRSYHMLITVPIQTTEGVFHTKVEIQIRTIAMDFWASLEHKIYYKFEGEAPEYIAQDLKACATIVSHLDEKMLSLNEAIIKAKAKEKKNEDPLAKMITHQISAAAQKSQEPKAVPEDDAGDDPA